MLGLAIDLFSMTDFHDANGQMVIVNGIDNAVAPLPDTVVVLADKLLTTCRTGIIDKRGDAFNDAPPIRLGCDRFDFLDG
jgi:hypothetical protein